MRKYLLLLLLGLTPFTFAKETLEFSCDTEYNGKVSIHSTPKKSHYIYRFYKNGRLKLTIKHNHQQILQDSRNRLNKEGVFIMHFQNKNYDYSVYNIDFSHGNRSNQIGGIEIVTIDEKLFVARLDCIKIHNHLKI